MLKDEVFGYFGLVLMLCWNVEPWICQVRVSGSISITYIISSCPNTIWNYKKSHHLAYIIIQDWSLKLFLFTQAVFENRTYMYVILEHTLVVFTCPSTVVSPIPESFMISPKWIPKSNSEIPNNRASYNYSVIEEYDKDYTEELFDWN